MYECIVIGLGPVGATLGNLLGLQGIKTLIIERSEQHNTEPRAIHGDDEMLRIFQAMQLEEALLAHIEHFDTMELAASIHHTLCTIQTSNTQKPLGFPTDFWFHQPTLEAILRKGLQRFDCVEVKTGWEAVNIQSSKHAENLTIANTHSPKQKEVVRAQYILGADGANSWLRKQLGITLQDLKFEQRWLVIDTIAPTAGLPSYWQNTHRQICDPKRPITYVPATGDHKRWEIMLKPDEADLSEAKISELLQLSPLPTIQRKAVYTFHALYAQKWHAGNYFLCGDAAHQMPPFLGQGLCSGMRDAYNLSWKLAWMLKSNKPTIYQQLANSYQQERLPHTFALTKGAILLGKIIQTQNPFIATFRNQILKLLDKSNWIKRQVTQQIVKKQAFKEGLIAKNHLSGSLFPQDKLSHFESLSDNQLGNQFCLVVKDKATHLPSPLPHFLSYWEVANNCPALLVWFEKHRIDFVILRPDKVIWSTGKITDLTKAIQKLVQTL